MDLVEKYLGEIHGRGMGHVIKVKDKKGLKALLKSRNIKFGDTSAGITVGDDDWDEVEEYMARKGII